MKRTILSLFAALLLPTLAAAQVGTGPQSYDDLRGMPIVFLPGSDDVGNVARRAGEAAGPVPFIFYNEAYSGAKISIGNTTAVYLGAHHFQEGAAALKSGSSIAGKDVMTVEWLWDFNGDCVKITVSLERDPYQSNKDFAAEFKGLVDTQMGYYPPTCSNTSAGLRVASTPKVGLMTGVLNTGSTSESFTATSPGQNGVMSISWKHDPDGVGPLHPITVTASVEKRKNESPSSAAKRLKKQVDELMQIWPPNVPSPTGG